MDFVRLFCIILAIASSRAFGCLLHDERYNEELVVRPLADSHVNTYFQFSTSWCYGNQENLHNTGLVPRVIADLLFQYDIKELHISLTQGLWRYADWGYPIIDAAGGTEAWAWFSGTNLTDIDADNQWSRLMGVLSGILCVSLNFVDSTNSISPEYGFRPQFVHSDSSDVRQHVRYATLPREIVCTENLTPWKKLLPCGNSMGLVSLLNSGNVHNTKFHSLSMNLRTVCSRSSPNECSLQLTHTANLVYDLKLLEGNRNDFSLRRLFGQGLHCCCNLANSSKIYIERTEQGANFDLSPPAPSVVTTTRGGYTSSYAVYELESSKRADRLFNVACLERKEKQNSFLKPPLVYANRFVAGQGQQSGRIITEITNTHYEKIPILIQEVIPWFVTTYLHTLQMISKHDKAPQGYEHLKPKMLHFRPSKQRTAPTHMELGLSLPPKSTTRIAIDCDYMMLKWLEYPPDANNGHDIGSSVISMLLPLARNYTAIPVEGHIFADLFNATRNAGYYQTMHTEALIVSLPTPDFSMPYNVICLACTVVALAFGPIHSVATKRMTIDATDLLTGNILLQIWNKYIRRKKKVTATTITTTATTTEEQDEMELEELELEELLAEKIFKQNDTDTEADIDVDMDMDVDDTLSLSE